MAYKKNLMSEYNSDCECVTMNVWLSSTHNHITVLMTHVMEQCFNVSMQYMSLKIPESDALSYHV